MTDEKSRAQVRGDGEPASPSSTTEASSRERRSRPAFAKAATSALIGLVLAVGAVLAFRALAPTPAAPTDAASAIGGPFHLVDVNGRPVDQRLLLGKWSEVFFGYTNCPDTCPATLQALNAAGAMLGPARKDVQVVFISVDPARDTPAQMKLYTENQGYPAGGLVGLTGSPEEVKAVTAAYHVFYSKDGNGPDYAVQHTAAVYLMDPKGRFVKPLDETMPPATLAAQLRSAMSG